MRVQFPPVAFYGVLEVDNNEAYKKSLELAIQKWVDDMNETSDWRYSMPDQAKEECVAVMTDAAFSALLKIAG